MLTESKGSHVALNLYKRGLRVRVADIVSMANPPLPDGIEVLVGNLCETVFCRRATHGVHTVLHFAANMGGMGTIHEANDFIIYRENHAMTQLLLEASVAVGVSRFLYASSACVYPDALQTADHRDISLAEDDVWTSPPPRPQGLYGLEKLASEQLILATAARPDVKLEVRIARFHNVYGGGGAWDNGREKAPAALLRKALAARVSGGALPVSLEIWGDGQQRRSFLYVDDAVEAIWRLLHSEREALTVNVGSSRSVSIKDLAEISVRCADMDVNDVQFQYVGDRPIGVASRNADLTFVNQMLGWQPGVSLEDGMKLTGDWIKQELTRSLDGLDGAARAHRLRALQSSDIIHLQSDAITFALLLPITSRGSAAADDCLKHLAEFARSLVETTWRDVDVLGQTRFRFMIYLAIDEDDLFLRGEGGGLNKPTRVLHTAGVLDVVTIFCAHPRGHVCWLWRDLARRAYLDKCDYYLLVGDDIVFRDMDWMSRIHSEFSRIAAAEKVPMGFGCVAFTDESFPGMPTFPVVHRTHMRIFNGEVIPETFINQDGDPYLYQLYRRWGCSTMSPVRLTNKLGGESDARYDKQHTPGWTLSILDDATAQVQKWLNESVAGVVQKLTLDIVVPCYRVQLDLLNRILTLQSSSTCEVMFIIVVDDPTSPNIQALLAQHGARADVRIRVNRRNLGASASRNRGLAESAAEWVHFLDDDVVPDDRLLFEAEEVIRMHPDAAGFVGNTQFPVASTVFTAAIHVAGVTYFWDIATKIPDDIPWGVTANLIARRRDDGVLFDLAFPKTGGGEDIDYCLKKRKKSIEAGGGGFYAAPRVGVTHPWWSGGQRSYWRFYLWSKGDGGLIKKYPELSYADIAPNSAEALLLSAVVVFAGIAWFVVTRKSGVMVCGVWAAISVIAANVLHDMYRHLWRDAGRLVGLNIALQGPYWIFAVLESTLIRVWSEIGRTVGLLERGEVTLIGRRFDWFTARVGMGPMNDERKNSRERIIVATIIWAVLMAV